MFLLDLLLFVFYVFMILGQFGDHPRMTLAFFGSWLMIFETDLFVNFTSIQLPASDGKFNETETVAGNIIDGNGENETP